jgi:hypothetical protein
VARYDRAILPGREGSISLTLNTTGYQGQVQKSSVVYSNDPDQPQVTLLISGLVNPSVAIEPPAVLLEGVVSEDIRRTVTIRSNEPQALTLDPVQGTDADKVAYELKTIEEGREYQLVIRNISKQQDRYAGFIALKTNYAHKPELKIGYMGAIKAKIDYQPQKLTFTPFKKTNSDTGARETYFPSRTIHLSLVDGMNLTIEKLEFNRKYFDINTIETVAKIQYQLNVRVKPEALPTGWLREELKVYTNIEAEPVLSIPLEVLKK